MERELNKRNRRSNKRELSQYDVVQRFFAENPDLNQPLDRPHSAPSLGRAGPMLKRAIDTRNPWAYSSILQVWLRKIGLDPPKGVFADVHSGAPGRPREDLQQFVAYLTWIEMGHPPDSSVARKLIPEEWHKDHKKATDKIRNRRKRFQERFTNDIAGTDLSSLERDRLLEAIVKQVISWERDKT